MNNKGVRVCVTLTEQMAHDYKEIAKMTGFPVSSLIRRRLEVRGGIVAVPEAVTEELKVLQTLLDQAMKLGGFDSETLNAFKARVAFFERLIDFGTATTFIHRKKTRRKPKKEQEFKKG